MLEEIDAAHGVGGCLGEARSEFECHHWGLERQLPENLGNGNLGILHCCCHSSGETMSKLAHGRTPSSGAQLCTDKLWLRYEGI